MNTIKKTKRIKFLEDECDRLQDEKLIIISQIKTAKGLAKAQKVSRFLWLNDKHDSFERELDKLTKIH